MNKPKNTTLIDRLLNQFAIVDKPFLDLQWLVKKTLIQRGLTNTLLQKGSKFVKADTAPQFIFWVNS